MYIREWKLEKESLVQYIDSCVYKGMDGKIYIEVDDPVFEIEYDEEGVFIEKEDGKICLIVFMGSVYDLIMAALS